MIENEATMRGSRGGGPGEERSRRREPRVLQALLEASEEEFAYNELCLARAGKDEVGLLTFFPSKVEVPPAIALFEGDGSVRGFFHALQGAHSRGHYNVIHAHSPHVASLVALWNLTPRRKKRASTVFTVQHSYTNSNLTARTRWLDLLGFAASDRVVLVSEAARESFPSFFRRMAGARLSVVPHAADLDRIDRVLRHSAPRTCDRGFTVASVGRLIPIKNPLTLLESFLQVRSADMRLIYVGEGAMGRDVMQRVQAARAEDSVALRGLLPREQVFEALAGADLFVSISRGEGMPVAVLEAMACRCPVVLSDIAPHREIARNVDFIPLVPADDPEALAQEIARFRDMRPGDRRDIGERCRALVEARYSLTSSHARYESIYYDLLSDAT